MINIENEVFNTISVAVKTAYETAFVTGEYVPAPSSFPAVSIEEADNATRESTIDSSGQEKYVNVMYEVNVYSNKLSGRKTECKNILAIIDGEMRRLGFTRTMATPAPNADTSIYRMTARYQACVSSDYTIYGR